MKKLMLFSFAFLFLFSCKNKEVKPVPVEKATKDIVSRGAETPEPEIEDILRVPDEFADFLKNKMPGYQIVPREKWLSEEYLDQINKTFPDKVYYMDHIFQKGDFNGDGREDYATFLEDKKGNTALFAFHNTGNGFKKYRLQKEGKNDILGVGIQLEDEGFFVEGSGNKEAGHPNNGISYIIYEKDSKTFYFDEGKYKSFFTSD